MEQEPIDRGEDATAAAVALALSLLDQGETQELRRVLESLLESLGAEGRPWHREEPGAPYVSPGASYAGIPDRTLAAATAATLELVGNLDDAGFERAFDCAEVEHELLFQADVVAEQVLEAIPAEPTDEIVPGSGSPFATRTFADLLERQGHGAEAHTLRNALGGRETGPLELQEQQVAPSGLMDPEGKVVSVLERWLENLGRNSA